MADFGADVIKIEAPGQPDQLREWGNGDYRGRKLFWPVQARGKRCITLDLRQPRGQELMLDLVRDADVVIENMRPGTLERWNLGYDVLAGGQPGRRSSRGSRATARPGRSRTGPDSHRWPRRPAACAT